MVAPSKEILALASRFGYMLGIWDEEMFSFVTHADELPAFIPLENGMHTICGWYCYDYRMWLVDEHRMIEEPEISQRLGEEIDGFVYAVIRVFEGWRRKYYSLYVPNKFEDLTVIPESGYAMAFDEEERKKTVVTFGKDRWGCIYLIPDAMDDYIAWKKHREKIFGIKF